MGLLPPKPPQNFETEAFVERTRLQADRRETCPYCNTPCLNDVDRCPNCGAWITPVL